MIREECSSLNCLETVIHVANNYIGLQFPNFSVDNNAMEECQQFEHLFTKVDKPTRNSLLIFTGLQNSEVHCGLVLQNSKFIHKYKNGVCISKLDRSWRAFLYAIYSINNK